MRHRAAEQRTGHALHSTIPGTRESSDNTDIHAREPCELKKGDGRLMIKGTSDNQKGTFPEKIHEGNSIECSLKIQKGNIMYIKKRWSVK